MTKLTQWSNERKQSMDWGVKNSVHGGVDEFYRVLKAAT